MSLLAAGDNEEAEASEWDGMALAAAVTVTHPTLDPQAATGSTSSVPLSPVQQANSLYLVDEGEFEHRQKRRKLELQLLEEQIEAQKAMKIAMQKFAEMCERKNK